MPAVRFDHGLTDLLDGRPWETVAEGLGFVEGPVWLPDGRLLFSDIPNSRIRAWRDGRLGVYREPSAQSNGLTLDPQMRLISCEHEGRRVSIERDGRLEAVATHYDGKRLNSPNDVVCRSDGRIYFSDPPYGLEDNHAERELPFNGLFTAGPDGTVTLLSADFDRPNGLAFSPDERILYVADTPRHHVMAFEARDDGSLRSGRVFAEMREEGRPDGMKVDRDGRLYVCATGVQVFADDGRPLGIIDCPQMPANCTWGDDGAMLYITARTAVYRTRVATTGVAPYLR